MIYVLLRPQHDSVKRADGTDWQGSLRGMQVDPTILPHGGIVLNEIRCSSPRIFENVTKVTGYDAAGKAVTSNVRVQHDAVVLREEKGASGDPMYICKPTAYHAQYLAKLRDGWTVQVFKRDEDILRSTDDDTPTGETSRQEVTVPAVGPQDVPPPITVETPEKRGRGRPRKTVAQLREQADGIEVAGGAAVAPDAGEDELRAYIKRNAGKVAVSKVAVGKE